MDDIQCYYILLFYQHIVQSTMCCMVLLIEFIGHRNWMCLPYNPEMSYCVIE